MRPKQHQTTGSGDLFRARLEQIINMKHELVQLADKIDWAWIDSEFAPLYSDKGRPGRSRTASGQLQTKFLHGMLKSSPPLYGSGRVGRLSCNPVGPKYYSRRTRFQRSASKDELA